jgi:hypothetical protein
MTDARMDRAPAHRLQHEEARSIDSAMRATLWFVVIVLLLAWAGVADAATLPQSVVAAIAVRTV